MKQAWKEGKKRTQHSDQAAMLHRLSICAGGRIRDWVWKGNCHVWCQAPRQTVTHRVPETYAIAQTIQARGGKGEGSKNLRRGEVSEGAIIGENSLCTQEQNACSKFNSFYNTIWAAYYALNAESLCSDEESNLSSASPTRPVTFAICMQIWELWSPCAPSSAPGSAPGLTEHTTEWRSRDHRAGLTWLAILSPLSAAMVYYANIKSGSLSQWCNWIEELLENVFHVLFVFHVAQADSLSFVLSQLEV